MEYRNSRHPEQAINLKLSTPLYIGGLPNDVIAPSLTQRKFGLEKEFLCFFGLVHSEIFQKKKLYLPCWGYYFSFFKFPFWISNWFYLDPWYSKKPFFMTPTWNSTFIFSSLMLCYYFEFHIFITFISLLLHLDTTVVWESSRSHPVLIRMRWTSRHLIWEGHQREQVHVIQTQNMVSTLTAKIPGFITV